MVLPSCAVTKIHLKFPSLQYAGFKTSNSVTQLSQSDNLKSTILEYSIICIKFNVCKIDLVLICHEQPRLCVYNIRMLLRT